MVCLRIYPILPIGTGKYYETYLIVAFAGAVGPLACFLYDISFFTLEREEKYQNVKTATDKETAHD